MARARLASLNPPLKSWRASASVAWPAIAVAFPGSLASAAANAPSARV